MSTQLFPKILLCILPRGILPVLLACQAETKDRTSQMREMVGKMDAQISFYGKLLDQDGHPVEGVDVRLSLLRFVPNPASYFTATIEIRAKTDMYGCFTVLKERG